jgi:CHAT domain-containing protein
LKPILETMLNVLGQQLIGPLASRLRELCLERGIFVPFGRLSALPLHAARYEGKDGPSYFLDEFEITYAPGAWAIARDRVDHSEMVKNKLFSSGSAVGAFVQAEVEAVTNIAAQSLSAPVPIAYEPTITPQSLLDQAATSRYLHLAHTIDLNVDDPLKSAIMLPEGERLELADLLGMENLERVQLVTLSAAQPMLPDRDHFPEMGGTFPASFLEAGVASVVSNLWRVNDLSTSLLMKRFYTYHFQGGLAPSAALRQAQRWLREEVTAGEAAGICRRLLIPFTGPLSLSLESDLTRRNLA